MEDFKFNSKQLPENFPREFDAHIYFDLDGYEKAKKIRDKMRDVFRENGFFIGDLIPKNIGPHSMPMFEVNFSRVNFAEVVLWLMENRENFSVLIHPITGDDYLDHTQKMMWLGEPVKLYLDKL